MGMAQSLTLMERSTQACFTTAADRGLGNYNMPVVTCTRENGEVASIMGMAHACSQTETSSRVPSSMATAKALEFCCGHPR